MNCCICGQIAGDPSNDLLARIANEEIYSRRIPIETENFAIIPSIGPLVAGHVILCPKKHMPSMASLSEACNAEVDQLLTDLTRLLQSIYSQPVHLFEHGMSGRIGSRTLCTVDHAHLHVLPTDVSVISALKCYPTVEVARGLTGLRNAVGLSEYVFYESPDGDRLVVLSEDRPLPAQFLRQIFAAALGNSEEWNWRDHMKPEETLDIYRQLRSKVSEAESLH